MAGIDQCEDFMMFQRALTQLRGLDDKVRVEGEKKKLNLVDLTTTHQFMLSLGQFFCP